MQYPEFIEIMQPCVHQFGGNDFNEYRLKILFERVKELGSNWMKDIVQQVCLSNSRFFNFEEAARNEFTNRSKIKNTEDVVKALAFLSSHQTDAGYLKAMRLFGATNFTNAVENCMKFKMYEFTLPELQALEPVICEKMGI